MADRLLLIPGMVTVASSPPERSQQSAAHPKLVKVLFVNTPFASLRPALGVSLLKGHLERMGVQSDIAYLNLAYAARIGIDSYRYIAEMSLPQALLGEWIFSSSVFESLEAGDDEYLDMIESRSGAPPAVGGFEVPDRPTLCRVRADAVNFIDAAARSIAWDEYDIVGFTTTFNQNLASIALAQWVKTRFPRIVTVFGGANCEGEMGLQLHRSFPMIDVVCSGEADTSFPRLVACLQTGQEIHTIPGVISRRDGESVFVNLAPERVRDLDALPYPVYDDYLEQYARYISPSDRPIVLMETSRGCWWGEKSHCTFCGLNGLSMTYRAKSPARALAEIHALTSRYATTQIEMVDNILDMKYFHSLLPRLRNSGISLQMFYETKANLGEEQVRMLRDAGVTALQPGIESLSTAVLRLMRKGTTAAQNIQLLKWCKQFGITCNWNLIYGFPHEDPDEYQKMARLIPELHHLNPPLAWGRIRLDRFSPNFFDAQRLGVRNVRPDHSYPYIYALPDEAIANLAYYFEFDYEDSRDPPGYTADVRLALRRWTSGARESRLDYSDDGTRLTIHDTRTGRTGSNIALRGAERTLYLYCMKNRTWQQIASRSAEVDMTEDDAETFVQRMIDLGLMVEVDGRYLALAIPTAPVESHAERMPRVAEAVPAVTGMVELRDKLEVFRRNLSPAQQRYLANIRELGANGDSKGDGENPD